jgi:hypothetical protein
VEKGVGSCRERDDESWWRRGDIESGHSLYWRVYITEKTRRGVCRGGRVGDGQCQLRQP